MARICEAHIGYGMSIKDIAANLKISIQDVEAVIEKYKGNGTPILVHLHYTDESNDRHLWH